ncbi:MAG: hypothetical protein HYV32_03710 [Candidatus Kerfeldbacteria bacterium]|nr:hypothetical protein [Candidatus Kerfeldbacteria bacterium]
MEMPTGKRGKVLDILAQLLGATTEQLTESTPLGEHVFIAAALVATASNREVVVADLEHATVGELLKQAPD